MRPFLVTGQQRTGRHPSVGYQLDESVGTEGATSGDRCLATYRFLSPHIPGKLPSSLTVIRLSRLVTWVLAGRRERGGIREAVHCRIPRTRHSLRPSNLIRYCPAARGRQG